MAESAYELGYAVKNTAVQVLAKQSTGTDEIVGTAFEISPEHLLSCAHVIKAALNSDGKVILRRFHSAGWSELEANLVAPALGEMEDLSLLKLIPTDELKALDPVGLKAYEGGQWVGTDLFAHGLPNSTGEPEIVHLQCNGVETNMALCIPKGHAKVTPGLSGGPVLNVEGWAVGVFRARKKGDEQGPCLIIPVTRAIELFGEHLAPSLRVPFYSLKGKELKDWTDEEKTAIGEANPHSLYEYCCQLCVSTPEDTLEPRFVRLQLQLGKQRIADGDPEAGGTVEDIDSLQQLLEKKTDRVYLLKGEPGAGKTVQLQHLRFLLAQQWINSDANSEDKLFPVFVSLSEQDEKLGDPAMWLEKKWKHQYPYMPGLKEVGDHAIIFLLDGLNELHANNPENRRHSCVNWAQWFAQLPQKHKAIWACRIDDYTELALFFENHLRLPSGTALTHVQVLALDDARIKEILKNTLRPDLAEQALCSIEENKLWSLYNTPLALRLLVQLLASNKPLPNSRADLFSNWLLHKLRHEWTEKKHSLSKALDGADTDAIIRNELPWECVFLKRLCDFAYHRQRGLLDSDDQAADQKSAALSFTHKKFDRFNKDSESELSNEALKEIMDLALRLGVLRSTDEAPPLLSFRHQLFLEFFAAVPLAQQSDLSFVSEASGKDLSDVYKAMEPWQQLPGARRNNWEQTALFAASLSDDPQKFIQTLSECNLALAGQCAAALPTTKRRSVLKLLPLTKKLKQRMQDSKFDLRLRIAAANSLGELGALEVLGYERCGQSGAHYWRGPAAEIPAGDYQYGSADGGPDNDEHAGVWSNPAPYLLDSFTITNAQWSDFQNSGAYQCPDFWQGQASKDFREHGSNQSARDLHSLLWDRHHDSPGWEDMITHLDPVMQERYRQALIDFASDRNGFITNLVAPPRPPIAPAFWSDARFNKPLQPVVGLSLYEAQAYCLWLSDCSGVDYFLPHELQWEAAARGANSAVFPWGNDWDQQRCNTLLKSGLRRVGAPLPVGLLCEGATPADRFGNRLYELSGGVWEWTRSRSTALTAPERDTAEAQPQIEGSELRRVVRGGCWYDQSAAARSAYRDHDAVDIRDDSLGFRVCRASPR